MSDGEILEITKNIGEYTAIFKQTIEDGPEMILYKHHDPIFLFGNLNKERRPRHRIRMFGPELEKLVENIKKIL